MAPLCDVTLGNPRPRSAHPRPHLIAGAAPDFVTLVNFIVDVGKRHGRGRQLFLRAIWLWL